MENEEVKKVKKKSGFFGFIFKLLLFALLIIAGFLIYFSYIYKDNYVKIPVVTEKEYKKGSEWVLDSQYDGSVAWKEGGHTRLFYDSKHPIIEVKQKDPNVENILIFGIDSRNINDYKCRSDSIMVLSINRIEGTTKLISIMRDSGVYIGDTKDTLGTRLNKINSAYHYGGVGEMINTINVTFDLDIQKFVMLDFSTASKLVDLCGGVEVEIKDKELKYLNHFIKENNKLNGTDSPKINSSGLQTLDGIQAVSWSRIRYADSDFVRTSRQRTIAVSLMKKAKTMNIVDKLKLLNNMPGVFETNISFVDMLRIFINAYNGIGDIIEYRIPEDGLYEVQNNPWMMKINYKKQNVKLHDFIWG